MKIAAEFIRNQQTPQPELISVGIPPLTVLRPKLSVEYGIWTAGENDQEAG